FSEVRPPNMSKMSKINYFTGLVFSFVFSLSFFFLAVPNLKKKVIEKKELFTLNSRIFSKTITFPQKSDFVLKLKYDYKNTDGEVVFLNGNKLELRASKRAKDIVTRYYFAPYEIGQEGNNLLKIEFFPQAPPNIDLRWRNYLGATEDKNIVVCLRHSLIIKNKKEYGLLFFLNIIFFIFSFFLWQGSLKIAIDWVKLKASQAYFNNLVIFIPLSSFYLLIALTSRLNFFRIAVSPTYLFIFLFFAVFLAEVFLLFLSLAILFKREEKNVQRESEILENLPPVLKWSLLWIKTRAFSDKCILFFMLLLVLCAFLLILEMKKIAEHLANIAYLVLVLGVGIKFVKMIKEERKKS
ncbi:MAG: hypothetical protein NC928_01510, partial [Candidatus Omnitrophica bacterium]|nr:hypothetical protein [Candidatus Omnitrophota bacterium]